jgi:hypothetical protein
MHTGQRVAEQTTKSRTATIKFYESRGILVPPVNHLPAVSLIPQLSGG